MEAGRSMCSRDEQFQKMAAGIDEIESGRVTEDKNLQYPNRHAPRDVTVLRIMMERNELELKAPSPRDINEAGSLMDWRDLHAPKADNPIDVSVDGNLIEDRLIQAVKV